MKKQIAAFSVAGLMVLTSCGAQTAVNENANVENMNGAMDVETTMNANLNSSMMMMNVNTNTMDDTMMEGTRLMMNANINADAMLDAGAAADAGVDMLNVNAATGAAVNANVALPTGSSSFNY